MPITRTNDAIDLEFEERRWIVMPWIFMQFHVFANVIKVMRSKRRSISLVA